MYLFCEMHALYKTHLLIFALIVGLVVELCLFNVITYLCIIQTQLPLRVTYNTRKHTVAHKNTSLVSSMNLSFKHNRSNTVGHDKHNRQLQNWHNNLAFHSEFFQLVGFIIREEHMQYMWDESLLSIRGINVIWKGSILTSKWKSMQQTIVLFGSFLAYSY